MAVRPSIWPCFQLIICHQLLSTFVSLGASLGQLRSAYAGAMASPKMTPFAVRMVGTPASSTAPSAFGTPSSSAVWPAATAAPVSPPRSVARSPRSPLQSQYPNRDQRSPAPQASVYHTPAQQQSPPTQPATGRAARLEGPREIKPHERQQLLSCDRTGADEERHGWADSGPDQCDWLWSEANLASSDNCAAILSRDGRVVAAAAFSVCELATAAVRHTGSGEGTALRLGLTDTRAAPSYNHQARLCLRAAIRQQETQGVLLSLLPPRAAGLGADELATLGFCATASGVDTYTLFRSDVEHFPRQPDANAFDIAISLLDAEPSDGVLRALHWLYADERSSANQVVRNLAQTRRVHTLPCTFTKIARRIPAPATRGVPAELVAYVVCQYPAELPDGTVRPLTVLEGSGERDALGMLIRDALLEHRQQPGAPRFEEWAQHGGGAVEPVAAVVHAGSRSSVLSSVLLAKLGPERVAGRGAHFARISQPVELLRTLAAAGMLGSAAHAAEGLVEFSLTLFDEDDVAISAGEREVPGTLICLRYVDSAALPTAQGTVGQASSHAEELHDSVMLIEGAPRALPTCLDPDVAGAMLSHERSKPNLLGLECVRGSDGPLHESTHHYVDSTSYAHRDRSQPPSLSVSALGREVEAMGTRVSHWSAARPARPLPAASYGATSPDYLRRRRRPPIGRVVQRRDGGVQVFRPGELGEPATCTRNWLWNCCGDESSGGDRPPSWASGGGRMAVPEGVPPLLRASQQSAMTSSVLMGESSISGMARLDMVGHSGAAEDGGGTVAAGAWVVEYTQARSPFHATVSRTELCGALFGGPHGGGSAVPQWLRETVGCEGLSVSDLDWC